MCAAKVAVVGEFAQPENIFHCTLKVQVVLRVTSIANVTVAGSID